MQSEQQEVLQTLTPTQTQTQSTIITTIFSIYRNNYRQTVDLLNANTRISEVLFQLLTRIPSQFGNTYNTRIINILHTMYNDNVRKITLLNETNARIREHYVQFMIEPITTPLPNEVLNTPRTPSTTRTTRTTQPENDPPHRANHRRTYGRTMISDTSRLSTRYHNLFSNFFEPINVYPTEEQINIAVTRFQYSDIISPTNTSCPISLEPFENTDNVSIINHCQHIFKTNNLNQWFRTNHKCPVCRYDIRTYSSPPTSSQQTPRTTEVNYDDNSSDDEVPDLTEEPSISTQPNTSSRLSNALNSFINATDSDLTDPVLIVRFLYNL